jgi:hypothetical protein
MLRWNWGRAYEIDHDAGGPWRARRRDGHGGDITAMTPETLRDAIFRDYDLSPVPRRGNVTARRRHSQSALRTPCTWYGIRTPMADKSDTN